MLRAMQLPEGQLKRARDFRDFGCYVALMSNILNSEPSTYDEAVGQQYWKEAMMEEYESIMKNDVWEVVPRPDGKSVVTLKWIFKIKHAVDGSIDKYR